MKEIITIKFNRDKELFQAEEIKKFILNKKINSYKAEFFQDGGPLEFIIKRKINLY